VIGTAPQPIEIDVFSDVVCPWCYLGKRRLAAALTLVPEIAATVSWRPFRLDPTIPREGIDRAEYVRRKFGGPDGVAGAHDELTSAGKKVGIDFRFERIARSPNSIDAHRLVRWAGTVGRQDTVVERMFRAYFTEGADVGDDLVLAALAGESGIDAALVAKRLVSDEDRAAVEEEVAHAYKIGVAGVPCFIIGKRYAVMGAQLPETIADAIRTVSEERDAETATGLA